MRAEKALVLGNGRVVSFDEEIQVMRELGLSFSQAKVYLTLAKLGTSPAKAISESSHVARQDLYRVLFSLQEMGLVEKVIENPTLFEPIPLQDGLRLLWEKRKQENAGLQIRMKQLAQNVATEGDYFRDRENEFVMVRKKETVFRRLEILVNNTESSIDIATSLYVAGAASILLHGPFKKALKRGVRIRRVNEELEKELGGRKLWHHLDAPNYEMRFVQARIPISLGINDGKIAVLFLCPKANVVPAILYSNSSPFVSMCQECFDKTWETAREYRTKEYQPTT
jgi:sugar-specific transcriptional regulator TrmB